MADSVVSGGTEDRKCTNCNDSHWVSPGLTDEWFPCPSCHPFTEKRFGETIQRADAAEAELEAVKRSAVDLHNRIRELHQPVRLQVGSETHGGPPQYGEKCKTCRVFYPCPTVALLPSEPPTEERIRCELDPCPAPRPEQPVEPERPTCAECGDRATQVSECPACLGMNGAS